VVVAGGDVTTQPRLPPMRLDALGEVRQLGAFRGATWLGGDDESKSTPMWRRV